VTPTYLQQLLDQLFALPDIVQLAWVSAHGLVVLLLSFLFLMVFNSWTKQVMAWTPVAPFFAAVCMVFALFLAFHAASVWENKRAAERAFIHSGNAIRAFNEMVGPGQLDDRETAAKLRRYVVAVTEDEWGTFRSRQPSARVGAAFLELEDSVNRLAARLPVPTGNRLYALLNDIGRTRSDRLWIDRNHTDFMSWLGVLLLGYATHLAVAAVHFDRPRAGAVALALFATATTIAYWSLGVVDDPYRHLDGLNPSTWLLTS
jgi:hypothetical protein